MSDLAPTSTSRVARPSLLMRAEKAPNEVAEARPGPLALLGTSVWFGLIAGPLELGLVLVRDRITDEVTPASLQTSRHALWMIPVSSLLIFAACGLLLALAARLAPRFGARLGLFLLPFLASLGVLLAIPGLYPIASLLLACGIAYRASRLMRSHAVGFRRVVRLSTPALAIAMAVGVGLAYDRTTRAEARALASLPKAPAGAPNVLLLVLDTVRAESLSLHGYGRETSPNLVRLARKGSRFEHARAPASWTLPSHASMFTGRWPHELSATADRPLDATYPTLAEFLSSHGYVTGGFVANTHYCNAAYGLDRGFAHYDDYAENRAVSPVATLRSSELGKRLVRHASALAGIPDPYGPRKDAPRIQRDALDWLAAHPGRPYFAFLNYFDAHDPYLLPAGASPRFGKGFDAASYAASLKTLHQLSKAKPTPQTAEQFRATAAELRDAYDDCIAYLDEQLGKLFDELEGRGLLENTMVIVTSDHGEHLGERQLFGHGRSLYRPLVDVPLVIVPPSGRPSSPDVRAPVSLRDLPATVADLAGLGEASPFPGRSLARHWEASTARSPASEDPPLSEVDISAKVPDNLSHAPAGRGPMKSLVAEEKVYIRNGDGLEELYDLDNDPSESHNLATSPDADPTLRRFRATLERILKGKVPPARPR